MYLVVFSILLAGLSLCHVALWFGADRFRAARLGQAFYLFLFILSVVCLFSVDRDYIEIIVPTAATSLWSLLAFFPALLAGLLVLAISATSPRLPRPVKHVVYFVLVALPIYNIDWLFGMIQARN